MNLKQIVAITLLALTASAAHADNIEYSKPDKNVATLSAATVSTSRLLSKDVPLTLTVKDLDSSWQYVTLNEMQPKNDGAPSKTPSSIPDAIDNAIHAVPNVYLTQWQTATSGGQSFLIAYRVVPMITSEKLRVSLSEMPPLTARFALRSDYLDFLKTEADKRPLDLTLLNLQTIGVANTIKPYDPKERDADLLLYILLSGFRETPNKLDFQSMRNLNQLMIGALQYAQEYDGKFPQMQNITVFKKVVSLFVSKEEFFIQPSNKKPYVTNAAREGQNLLGTKSPEKFAMIYEAQPGSDGKRAVAFADGHVKRVTKEEWTKIKQDSNIN